MQVSVLADKVIAFWKSAVNVAPASKQANATSAQPNAAIAANASVKRSGAGVETAAMSDLRTRAQRLLLDALHQHIKAHSPPPDSADQGPSAAQQPSESPKPQVPTERLSQLATAVEQALLVHFQGRAESDYKGKLRALATSLKCADGVAVQLLNGQYLPAQLPGLDSRALMPGSERQRLEEKEEKRRRGEQAWQSVSGVSNGTYLTDKVRRLRSLPPLFPPAVMFVCFSFATDRLHSQF